VCYRCSGCAVCLLGSSGGLAIQTSPTSRVRIELVQKEVQPVFRFFHQKSLVDWTWKTCQFFRFVFVLIFCLFVVVFTALILLVTDVCQVFQQKWPQWNKQLKNRPASIKISRTQTRLASYKLRRKISSHKIPSVHLMQLVYWDVLTICNYQWISKIIRYLPVYFSLEYMWWKRFHFVF